ncbi:MAG TPA: adenylyl-sulfate kinase [Polyangiaceae bacterium]|nr:adenylyl-sulfate kinase [Polyangiaceae bacterium]
MNGLVVWLTGLPQAGKSTLAARLRAALLAAGESACILDGDEVREAISPVPGYGQEARDAFYATLGQLAALLAKQGLTVIVPATAHLRRYRDAARAIAPGFIEVHVATPMEECARRDEKGLYARAPADLPGVHVAYEPPRTAEVVAQGGRDEAALDEIVRAALAQRHKACSISDDDHS